MAVIRFENGFHGTYCIQDQTLKIGHEWIQPYDMTFGAVASCFYVTFLGVLNEHGITVRSAEVTVDGRKRTKVPTTLEYLKLTLKPESEASREELEACMNEALGKCSMVATVKAVAQVEAELVLPERKPGQ